MAGTRGRVGCGGGGLPERFVVFVVVGVVGFAVDEGGPVEVGHAA